MDNRSIDIQYIWVDKWMDSWTKGWTKVWVNMDRWVDNRSIHIQKDGLMERWMDE